MLGDSGEGGGGVATQVGELFAGYGGLGLGVSQVFQDCNLAWVSEIDKAANKIQAHHWPDVPNLGDITAIDWKEVLGKYGKVDILTGGFPCLPGSIARR